MLVHLSENIEGVPQDLVTLEFRLRPVRRPLFDFKRIPVSEVFAKPIHRLAKYPLSFAFVYFERTDLVDEVVEHVPEVHGVQHAESEVNRELQSRLPGGCLDSIAILEQQQAEAVETRVLQREAILGLIHAEAAWTARTCREEDV